MLEHGYLRERSWNYVQSRFSGCETGCHGVVFVRMSKDAAAQRPPMELAEAIIRDAAATKRSRTR